MSAFMVSPAHLSALAAAALACRAGSGIGFAYYHGIQRRELGPGDEDKLVGLLYAENRRSVMRRYYGEQIEEKPPRFVRPRQELPPVVILKLIDCFDYQACETDDYEESDAAAFCRALRLRVIHELPGYDAAPWGL